MESEKQNNLVRSSFMNLSEKKCDKTKESEHSCIMHNMVRLIFFSSMTSSCHIIAVF